MKGAFCVKCATFRPVARSRRRYHCVVCRDPVQMPSKMRNVPTRSKHTGRVFQSKKEAHREPSLLAELNCGQITDLQYQVPFRLEFYSTQAVERLLRALVWDEPLPDPKGPPSEKELLRMVRDVQRSRQCVCKYVADFTYYRDGRLVVEDPKGYRKPEYRIKKKLMVLAHNIEIQEPSEGGVQQRARGAGIHGRGTGSRLYGGR